VKHGPDALRRGFCSKPGAAGLPGPFSCLQQETPRRRLRPGSDGAARKCLARGPAIGARWRGRGFDGAPPTVGGARGATPRLAATGCASACRLRRWRSSSARHEGRATDTPHGLAMELPRHASSRWPHAAARALPPAVGVLALSALGRKPVKPIRGDAESATAPFGAVRPLRPCLVVNPGGCMAVPRASWPQPSGANNFPSATRIPRAANSLRLPVLHCVSAASGATRPTPADRITTRTRWARPC